LVILHIVGFLGRSLTVPAATNGDGLKGKVILYRMVKTRAKLKLYDNENLPGKYLVNYFVSQGAV
jgi:hypothetical protein